MADQLDSWYELEMKKIDFDDENVKESKVIYSCKDGLEKRMRCSVISCLGSAVYIPRLV